MGKFISFDRLEKIKTGYCSEELVNAETIINTDNISKLMHFPRQWNQCEKYKLYMLNGDTYEISEKTFNRIKGILIIAESRQERLLEITDKIDKNIEERDSDPAVRLKPEAILKKKLNMLPIRSWIKSRLRNSGIYTLGDLCSKTPMELMKIRPFGWKAVREIEEYLKSINLSLRKS